MQPLGFCNAADLFRCCVSRNRLLMHWDRHKLPQIADLLVDACPFRGESKLSQGERTEIITYRSVSRSDGSLSASQTCAR